MKGFAAVMSGLKAGFRQRHLIFTRQAMDGLYGHYNRRNYIHPDPLEFLYDYDTFGDREIVGFIASALAYGRVAQINRSVANVLGFMGRSPREYLLNNRRSSFEAHFCGFRHRFTTGEELAALLEALRRIVTRYGSLEECFAAKLGKGDSSVLEALTLFVEELGEGMDWAGGMFLPSPVKGSACKRLNLFLRWMVRCDDVDPGVWHTVSPSLLLVPVDTHMHRMGRILGLTRRKQADLKTTQEITEGFRSISPEDPVKYDFALTRPGIRGSISE